MTREKQLQDFADWVAELIFEEGWELNMAAFPERACRRLEKLGIVKRAGDEWVLVKAVSE